MAYQNSYGVHNFWEYKTNSVDTIIKFQEKCPYLCLCLILSETHGSADTYFYVGMSLLPAKRKMKFVVKS